MRNNQKEYLKIAAERKNALDYPDVTKDHEVVTTALFWLIIKNKYPYDSFDGYDVKEHFLIIPKNNYYTQPYQITRAELEEYNALLKWVHKYAMLRNYEQVFVVLKLEGKSLEKLHWHVIMC